MGNDSEAGPSGDGKITTTEVRLNRGGPQWETYHKLPAVLRKEWDAIEDVVGALAAGKAAYAYGTAHPKAIKSECWISEGKGASFTGLTHLETRQHLHEILMRNGTEEFYLIITTRELDGAEAQDVCRVIQPGVSSEVLLESRREMHCVVAEATDHDYFVVTCRMQDKGAIIAAIQGAILRAYVKS